MDWYSGVSKNLHCGVDLKIYVLTLELKNNSWLVTKILLMLLNLINISKKMLEIFQFKKKGGN